MISEAVRRQSRPRPTGQIRATPDGIACLIGRPTTGSVTSPVGSGRAKRSASASPLLINLAEAQAPRMRVNGTVTLVDKVCWGVRPLQTEMPSRKASIALVAGRLPAFVEPRRND